MPPAHTIPSHIRRRSWKRDQQLNALGHENYAAYLRSPQWNRIRRKYRAERPWICNLCGAEHDLQLHHRTYEHVGRERLDDLMPLCEGCHEMVHALERRGDSSLDFDGIINEARAIRNRDATDAQRAAIQAERMAEREAFKASLEVLPLDERIRRAIKAVDRTRRSKVLQQRRIINLKLNSGKLTREFLLRRIEAMEYLAYRFDL